MKRIQFPTTLLALAILGLPLYVGCGDSASSSSPTAQTPSSVAAGGGANAAEAGTSSSVTVVAEGAETAPAQTVAIFLDSLRKGDEQAANGVLTTLARQELAKTAYVIQPLGTPAGQYQIGRVGFPYPEKNIALVECTWTEPAAEGGIAEVMDIVCEVQQEPEGWRISGIGVTIPGTDQALVLDFEDSAGLQATIDAATGQSSRQVGGQVAGSDPRAASSAGSPPALPSFPTSGNAPQINPENPQQIALPQFNNAPVNR